MISPLGIISRFLGLMSKGAFAFVVEDYLDVNAKAGLQHEGSTLLRAVAGNASNDTIFLTGSKPVVLKGRKVGYSGVGVSSFIFESPSYTGGNTVDYQNANAINPITGESTIIVGATIDSDGILVFSPVHSLGNQSNQGKGAAASALESERILKPNTAYLLRLTSLDSQPQDIAAHLSFYEGVLDIKS